MLVEKGEQAIMTKRELGNTGFHIAPVVYGGIVSMEDGQDASDRYVSWAIDRGINYFDVAPSYGDAQEKLGNSIKSYRKNIYLACKTGCRLENDAQKEFEESLKMLHTDYFDVYQLHALSNLDDIEQAFGPKGTMELMIRAKKEGLVRKLGITCHNEDIALKALSLYEFDTIMFPFNWGINMGKEFGSRVSQVAKENRIGLFGMKTLIHRAWMNDEERNNSSYTKSWCKPISGDEELSLAALKYSLSMGADALVPPGNFEHFSYVVDKIEECINNPISNSDRRLLEEELVRIDGQYFF